MTSLSVILVLDTGICTNRKREYAESSIHIIRGQKVMLDADLAILYGIETKALKRAVKRNMERFPEDFMFQLSKEDVEYWMSQFVMSNPKMKMGLRKRPYVFTEQGVAMPACRQAGSPAFFIVLKPFLSILKSCEPL